MRRWWSPGSSSRWLVEHRHVCGLLLSGVLLTGQLQAGEADSLEPLPTSGADQRRVVSALIALGEGDPAPLLALPRHLLSEPPAIADAHDPELARRWTAVVPEALARLPAERRAAVAQALGLEHDRQHQLANAFDRGRLIDVLVLGPGDPRATVARALLGLGNETLPQPALPLPGVGPIPFPSALRLAHGDGWLFGLDQDGGIRWQRHCERMARIAVGVDGALVAETSGLSAIDLDGAATRLPPLPSFARPLACHGAQAWFHAGSTAWRLLLPAGTVTVLDLGEAPLGAPLLRGADAWWLTAKALIHTHDAVVVERLPHLLALSVAAALQDDPRGAVIRDGERWWLVGDRATATPAARIEATLLAGQRSAAQALLADSAAGAIPDDLRVRVTWADPHSDQQRALVALATERSQLDALPGNPLLTEVATDLALPVTAWRHRMTLAAWRARSGGPADNAGEPEIRLRSDATTIRLSARWPSTPGTPGAPERWWERTWPVYPLLDAPSRSWAAVPGAVVAVDGAVHLVIADDRTGELVVAGEMPNDIEPTLVVRLGAHAAAALVDEGRSILYITPGNVRRLPCPADGAALAAVAGHLQLTLASGGTADIALP